MRAPKLCVTVVCALLSEDYPAWAVGSVLAVSERWQVPLPEKPVAARSAVPGVRVVARSAVPGVRVVARSEDATHGMPSQLAH